MRPLQAFLLNKRRQLLSPTIWARIWNICPPVVYLSQLKVEFVSIWRQAQ
jgi:hypothetical protein